MADELDLHYERAQFPDAAQATLSAVSRAHHFKHHYVSSVRIMQLADGTTQLGLELAFPGALPDSARDEVNSGSRTSFVNRSVPFSRSWLMDSRPTAAVRSILVEARDEVVPVRMPIDAEALGIIVSENAKARIIDHGENTRSILEALKASRAVAILGAGEDDKHGRDDILQWLESRLAQDHEVLRSERLRLLGGAASDVLSEWAAAVDIQIPAVPNEKRLRIALMGALLANCDRLKGCVFFRLIA